MVTVSKEFEKDLLINRRLTFYLQLIMNIEVLCRKQLYLVCQLIGALMEMYCTLKMMDVQLWNVNGEMWPSATANRGEIGFHSLDLALAKMNSHSDLYTTMKTSFLKA